MTKNSELTDYVHQEVFEVYAEPKTENFKSIGQKVNSDDSVNQSKRSGTLQRSAQKGTQTD